MVLTVLVETYLAAMPELERDAAAQIVAAAVERQREKHSDWERFEHPIEFLATVFYCNHSAMPLDAYLETLYCAVKHGDYAKPWRQELKQRPTPGTPAPAAPAVQ